MREPMTKKEYELYYYIKNNNITNTSYIDLARRINANASNTRKRILSLQEKGYLIRSGTLIELIGDSHETDKKYLTVAKWYNIITIGFGIGILYPFSFAYASTKKEVINWLIFL